MTRQRFGVIRVQTRRLEGVQEKKIGRVPRIVRQVLKICEVGTAKIRGTPIIVFVFKKFCLVRRKLTSAGTEAGESKMWEEALA